MSRASTWRRWRHRVLVRSARTRHAFWLMVLRVAQRREAEATADLAWRATGPIGPGS